MKLRIFGIIFKIALAAAVISLVLLISVKAYGFGKAVFDEKPGTAENPVSVTVEVKEGDGIRQVAALLRQEGLVESTLVFTVQKYFYGSVILPGTYRLNSNMTGKNILDVLSGVAVDTEEDS
ncbi:endolytic transglycosylase MltG [Lacrimispora sp. NSJ-141]|uniref:Endolytic transglycosylase MltG n=1 Tax=Lientehia hominis TaxID=2897778 RepID=A0AAP2RGZ0_9FIRM|nr:endolytic transglycosylase MltG [Lientehia hominis]MCD2491420.1 endolytic transglycosylase MltG [Lientehia hominis]